MHVTSWPQNVYKTVLTAEIVKHFWGTVAMYNAFLTSWCILAECISCNAVWNTKCQWVVHSCYNVTNMTILVKQMAFLLTLALQIISQ